MQIGMIGMGRMGANMARRLIRAGHEVVVHDRKPPTTEAMGKEGATPAITPADMAKALKPPRAMWIMVPAHGVDQMIDTLLPFLSPGDIIIDGGNSHYEDDVRRGAALAARGFEYVDVGTSGGVWGLERGYCLMIGGKPSVVSHLDSVFAALAPGFDAAPRSGGRTGNPVPAERGYFHCGPHGAGHFVKMVHNAIEYGMMAAYAEGFNVLQHARTAPDPTAANPNAPLYEFNLSEIAELWRRGSVVGSWLLDLTALALKEDATLAGFAGRVGDSGEGRWTAYTAVERAVPTPVLTAALFARFSSRGEEDFANRLLSAMRHQFGGHKEPAAAT